MSRDMERRIRRLEVIVGGAARVIVVEWPGNDADAALTAKGIIPRPDDLVVVINKFAETAFEGWVSIDGNRVA